MASSKTPSACLKRIKSLIGLAGFPSCVVGIYYARYNADWWVFFQKDCDILEKLVERDKAIRPVQSKLKNQKACPKCNHLLSSGNGPFCPECGQRLDWQD